MTLSAARGLAPPTETRLDGGRVELDGARRPRSPSATSRVPR